MTPVLFPSVPAMGLMLSLDRVPVDPWVVEPRTGVAA